MFTPIEKFGAATTPSRPASASRRSLAACSPQPVVPITTRSSTRMYRGKLASSAGRRKVDGDIRRPPLVPAIVDASDDLDVLTGGQLLDQPAHLAVADDQQFQAHAKNSSCRRCMACGRSLCRRTTVMFRRDAACEIIFSGTSSSTPTTRAAISGSFRSRSPTAHSSAMSRSIDTSANSDSASTIASGLPSVVHRHRHAHLGRRHHVDRRAEALEHLEDAAQEAVGHQHAGRGDVDDGHVFLGGQPGERRAGRRRSRVISVPAPSGLHELRMRTGMLRSTAGRIVLGCSTLAPKYASSAASANDSCGTRRGDGDDARIGGEHAVHVGPDLNLARIDAGADDRAGIIRPTAPQRRRMPVGRRADESAEHGNVAGVESGVTVLRSAALVSGPSGVGASCGRRW